MGKDKRSTEPVFTCPYVKPNLARLEGMDEKIKQNEEALATKQERVTSPFRIYVHAIAIVLCGFFYGFGLASLNTFAKPFVPHYLRVKSNDPALMEQTVNYVKKWGTSAFLFGCTLTCGLGPFLVNFFGTRNLTYANIVLFIAVNAYMVADLNYKPLPALFVVRFISGFCVYLWTIIGPIYMKETVPKTLYTRVISSFNFLIAVGLAVGYFIGCESVAAKWRMVFGIPCIVETVRLLVLLCTRVNDPAWLSAKGAPQSVIAECFKPFYTHEVADDIAALIVKKRTLEAEREALKAATGGSSSSSHFDFLSADYSFQFVVGLALSLLNQLTAMNIITNFSDDIFKAGGIADPSSWSTAMAMISSLGTLVPIFGISLFGKRRLMIWGLWGQSFGLSIFLAGLAFNLPVVVFAGACFGMTLYNVSTGGILFGYIAEFVPKNGIFLAALIQSILGCTLAFNIMPLQKVLTLSGLFFIAQLFAVVGTLFFMLVGVETTNKNPAAIKEEFLEMKRGMNPFA